MVALRSESGVESGLDASTMFPSRRKMTRSAQPAWRASWVTSIPAAPLSQRSRSRRRTASPGLRVERSGGFVGEDQTAFTDDGTSDGDALALPAGHIVGEPVGKFVDADFAQ